MYAPTIVAIGGHSLLDPDQPSAMDKQCAVTAQAMQHVADLVAEGEPIVLIHGNGPQAGWMQLRSVLAKGHLQEVPLDAIVANTQGSLGYMLQRTLRQALRERGIKRPIATLVTEVRVDPTDQAFEEPTKPIGNFYSDEEAHMLSQQFGWLMVEDSPRGYRRLVPSPSPVAIVQVGVIRQLIDAGTVVICCGGGGVPVTWQEGGPIRGLEAVIDKDRVAALLAVELDAPRLVITTGVDTVFTDFGTPQQTALRETHVEEVRHLARQGHFPPGSMRPKMEASVYYLNRVNGEAIICSPSNLNEALARQSGTRIVRTETSDS
jgi:carbamate kinase